MYYMLLYLFLQIFYFGIVLSFQQVELFTGFLWTVELIIIFMFLLLLFYINAQGDFLNKYIYTDKFIYFIIFLVFIIICPLFNYYDFNVAYDFDTVVNWEDYYESVYNDNMNDFVGLYLAYYVFNSIEFVIIGVLLFIASIVCINLFRFTKIVKFRNYNNFLKTFKLAQSFTYCTFMRKQNIVVQANEKPSIRSFSGKNIKIKKKDDTKK